VERLGEGGDPERAEIAGKLLGTHYRPACVADPSRRRLVSRLGDPAGIRIDSDRLLKMRGEQQRQQPWAAPNVEQTPRAVQPKLIAEHLGNLGRGNLGRIRQTPLRLSRTP
jgi:hypothetical protein